MTTIKLEILGFYIDDEFPLKKHKHSGIYFVYSGYITGERKCNLTQLLYIGEAENIYQRFIDGHEKYVDWIEKLENKEQLFFSVTPVEQVKLRKIAEKALIYHHQPCCNDKSKDSFNELKTKIILSGKTNLLDTTFIVYPDKGE
jgi:hypothetical protein